MKKYLIFYVFLIIGCKENSNPIQEQPIDTTKYTYEVYIDGYDKGEFIIWFNGSYVDTLRMFVTAWSSTFTAKEGRNEYHIYTSDCGTNFGTFDLTKEKPTKRHYIGCRKKK
ncbi:MAG: hypothetical protein HW421_3957 [Ignavibacteria bacterium]|nr:hypothetical protein [Ignavibacteria bacterium]